MQMYPAVSAHNHTLILSCHCRAGEYVQKGVRWVCSGNTGDSNEPINTFSQDMEPEYVSMNEDDSIAFVVLQVSYCMHLG